MKERKMMKDERMIEIKLELRDDALSLCLRRLARHLDQHPELELVSYVHVVDGEYKHEVELRQRKYGDWRK